MLTKSATAVYFTAMDRIDNRLARPEIVQTADFMKKNRPEVSPQEEIFIHELIKEFNYKKAYLAAYGENGNWRLDAYQVFKRPHVLKRFKYLLQCKLDRCSLSSSKVLRELSRVAFFNIKNVCSWDENGHLRILSSDQISEDDACAISSVTWTKFAGKEKVTIRLHDKIKALEMLAKYFKMIEPDVNNMNVANFTVDMSSKTDGELWQSLQEKLDEINRKLNSRG